MFLVFFFQLARLNNLYHRSELKKPAEERLWTFCLYLHPYCEVLIAEADAPQVLTVGSFHLVNITDAEEFDLYGKVVS